MWNITISLFLIIKVHIMKAQITFFNYEFWCSSFDGWCVWRVVDLTFLLSFSYFSHIVYLSRRVHDQSEGSMCVGFLVIQFFYLDLKLIISHSIMAKGDKNIRLIFKALLQLSLENSKNSTCVLTLEWYCYVHNRFN